MSPVLSRRSGRGQHGVLAVEFAMVAIVLFTVLFAVLEMARMMYLWNTLQEVTRRAASGAAATDFSNPAAMDLLRASAVFRNGAGTLMLGDPVTDAHVRIEYLTLARDGNGALTMTPVAAGLMPACPGRNMINCASDPYGASCIRFVRARICAADGDAGSCNPVPYAPLPLIAGLTVSLPASPSIVRAGTLGYQPGDALCP